jgi:molecular chaperone DnaK
MQQSIIIKASSGLSEDEVSRMIRDAEAHAEEDRRQRALIDARNTAENMVHATRKSMTDLGDKVGDKEKAEINAAIEKVETAIKGDDKERIEEATTKLTEIAGKLAERVYKEAGQAQGQPSGASAGPGAGEPGQQAAGGNENVVDAEFEEVDEDKKN